MFEVSLPLEDALINNTDIQVAENVCTVIIIGEDTDLLILFQRHLIFLHAISGCNTTSAYYRQKKLKFVKLHDKNRNLHETFKFSTTQVMIPRTSFLQVNYSLLPCIHLKPIGTSLDQIRYEIFSKYCQYSIWLLYPNKCSYNILCECTTKFRASMIDPWILSTEIGGERKRKGSSFSRSPQHSF